MRSRRETTPSVAPSAPSTTTAGTTSCALASPSRSRRPTWISTAASGDDAGDQGGGFPHDEQGGGGPAPVRRRVPRLVPRGARRRARLQRRDRPLGTRRYRNRADRRGAGSLDQARPAPAPE